MQVTFKKDWPFVGRLYKKGEVANLSHADAMTAVDGGFAVAGKENKKKVVDKQKR